MTLRRMKTYTAETGYVYQYYFVGKREAMEAGAPAIEFIFDASSDRKVTFAVSVLLPRAALQSWAAAHGRQLTDSEQYAAAKLRLLRGFDEVDNMLQDGRRLALDSVSLEDLLAPLGSAAKRIAAAMYSSGVRPMSSVSPRLLS